MKINIITSLALWSFLMGTACHRPVPAATAPSPSSQSQAGNTQPNLFKRIVKGDETPKINARQLDHYVAQNDRSAASLLAAFRATGDKSFLQEAMQTHPDDPHVNFAALIHNADPPGERRRWLTTFKKSAPDNALANYLAALENFKSGQPAQAVQELGAASKKSVQDYSDYFVQNTREAYQAAGYSEPDAATEAFVALPLPHLAQLKELSQDIADLATKYRQSGDTRAAQSMIQTGLRLGQQLEDSTGAVMPVLVGIAIQKQILGGLNLSAPYGAAGQTVQNRLDALAQERDALQALARQQESVVSALPDEDVVNFFQQVTATGEIAAAHWAVNKYPAK